MATSFVLNDSRSTQLLQCSIQLLLPYMCLSVGCSTVNMLDIAVNYILISWGATFHVGAILDKNIGAIPPNEGAGDAEWLAPKAGELRRRTRRVGGA